MALRTDFKTCLNRFLGGLNLRLETLTAERIERERVRALVRDRHFERPAFPLLPAFKTIQTDVILGALAEHESRFDDLADRSRNAVGFGFANDYFPSPDAEVLYAFVRRRRPGTVVEVGAGNSTKLFRQAILDGGLSTRLVSFDPAPRTDVSALVDELHSEPVETLPCFDLFERLVPGDILFIDSSHSVRAGNDVAFLYLQVLPRLAPGVAVHVHDVFLPFDYPPEWVLDRGWNEQYLLQALLSFGDAFAVLWAGCYLQRTVPEFASHFPHWTGQTATSLWLERR